MKFFRWLLVFHSHEIEKLFDDMTELKAAKAKPFSLVKGRRYHPWQLEVHASWS